MKVKYFIKEDLSRLIEFNERIFPRRDKVAESIHYNFYLNPILQNAWKNIYIAENDNGSIIGQFMLLPARFFYKGVVNNAFWGMDYIVEETYRGSYIGALLANKAIKNNNYFSVGLSEVSLKIHSVLKQKMIGSVSKCIRPVSFFSVFIFLFGTNKKGSEADSFPVKIKTKTGVFNKVNDASEIVSKAGYWNYEALEFARNEEFLKWRFFHYKNKYLVYKYISQNKVPDSKPVYFVVRPVVWKNVNCLLLVDYRYDPDAKNLFREIINTVIMLTRQTGMAATIAGTSMHRDNRILKKKLFFSFKNEMKIVTRFPLNTDIKDQVLVTFADGDCDYYFGNRRW